MFPLCQFLVQTPENLGEKIIIRYFFLVQVQSIFFSWHFNLTKTPKLSLKGASFTTPLHWCHCRRDNLKTRDFIKRTIFFFFLV